MITDTINLDFAIIETGDPKHLIVQDLSTWGAIEERKAIIEIITPNREEPVIYYYNKNSYNNFNSSFLYLSSTGQYSDLPDGIYEITIKGSPSTDFCETKTYLKTDKTKIYLANRYLEAYLECEDPSNEGLKQLRKARLLLEAAKEANRVGKVKKAMVLLKRVNDQIKQQENCKDC